jgi:hypothetical protein
MKNNVSRAGLLLLFVALPCLAQTQDTGSGATSSPKPPETGSTDTTNVPKPAAQAKKKPKKVWTNDDMSSVNGGVSVVGGGDKSSTKRPGDQPSGAATGPAAEARQKQVESYRRQIQELQSQIDAADKRIVQLKDFKGENSGPTGGINPNQGYNMVPVEDQVRQLEEKKKRLQGKIDDVENEAQKNGIEPGELR